MIKKIIFFAVLAGLLAGTWAGLNYHRKYKAGYCFAEKRLITDKELVDTGVTQLLKNLEAEYQSLPPEEQAKRIRYKGLKDFYERQPRCCGFSGNKGQSVYPPPPSRVLYKRGWVKLVQYQFRIDGEKKFRSGWILVPFCGGKAAIHQSTRSIIVNGVVVHLPEVGDASATDPNGEINKMNIRIYKEGEDGK
ncbi:MAG: hypothetical protein ABJ275_10410 [Maricaulaceae bacterium]